MKGTSPFKGPFAPKRARPQAPGATSPALSFALKGEMLTEDEHRACLRGEMEVQRGHLLNLNIPADVAGFPTGTYVALYAGRARKLQIDALLGQREPEPYRVKI